MDSSSIVCMADSLLAAGNCQTPRLDTITYFDAQEPNWDELPYAQIVEQRRGRPVPTLTSAQIVRPKGTDPESLSYDSHVSLRPKLSGRFLPPTSFARRLPRRPFGAWW